MSNRLIYAGGRKSHRYDRWKSADRERLIHTYNIEGQINWTSSTQSYVGAVFPLLDYTAWPITAWWNVVGTGVTSDLVVRLPEFWNQYQPPPPSNPGSWGIIFNTWRMSYPTSVTVTWTLMRADGNDDSTSQFGIFPCNTDQYGQLTGPTPANRVPPIVPNPGNPGREDIDRWNNFKRQKGCKWKRIGNRQQTAGRRTIKIHIPLKKFSIPGFPDASSRFWTEHNCNNQTIIRPLSDLCSYGVMGIYLDSPSTNAIYDFTMKVDYYVTHFQPNLQLFRSCAGCNIPSPEDANGPSGPSGITFDSTGQEIDPCFGCPGYTGATGPGYGPIGPPVNDDFAASSIEGPYNVINVSGATGLPGPYSTFRSALKRVFEDYSYPLIAPDKKCKCSH